MKNAAIQILIYNPNLAKPVPPEEERGVVVNPRLKQRFEQFVPIGVYLEGSDLKYYFFDQCDKDPKIYSSLDELKGDLPENIFEKDPKLFIMGHASGGHYGMGNSHGESERLEEADLDNLISGFKQALREDHGEVFVTLEGCNTDNQSNAAAMQQEKTFLERVSAKHKDITFGGTGPWESQDAETGYRSLAPEAPITSMGGNVWKAGNSVIFHHEGDQFAVRKSLFASTKTAKELKVNTIDYARALLGEGRDELLAQIALRRDILNIQDLKKIDGFPELQFEGEHVAKFVAKEDQILGKEQENYLTRVSGILDRARADPIQLTDRDGIELLLGLKEPSVFKGHEDLLEEILANKSLLQLAMVSCGKVLVGGPSNDSIIDLLLKHGADINSVDEKGMTALHYAAQNFYHYREEPLNLIKKLLKHGASLEVKNNKGETPIETAQEHNKDGRVDGKDELLASLKYDNSPPTSPELMQSVKQIFQMSQHIAERLHSLPITQREYNKCSEGTLYIPENAVEKLHGVLQSAKGNSELLSVFESELSSVISALERGIGTGEVIGDADEFIPKCFEDAKTKLAAVMDKLIEMKLELAASASEGAEIDPKSSELKS